MRKLLKFVPWAAIAIAFVVVGGAFLLPSSAKISRSIEVAAPPAAVFAIVSSMKRFNEFSPWAEIDPATTYVFEGPDSGKGQKMSWKSANENVGEGSQTVVEIVENAKVVNDLAFGGMGTAKAAFLLDPAGAGTRVTWTLDAPLSGIAEKWIGFLLFDRWIGADYEKGLAKLKAAAEKS